MMKFVLFLVLPLLLIGCTTTSTKQVDKAGETRFTAQQLAGRPETEGSSVIEVQKILEGRLEHPRPEDKASSGAEVQKPMFEGKEGIKLAEPAPEALRHPGRTDKVGTPSQPKSQPWGSFWHAPLKQSSPSDGNESSSKNIETPPPTSWKDYKEVDFGKFASGSYSSDYANKYVKTKCRFSGIATELGEIPKYKRPSYITFFVTGVNSQLYTLKMVVSGAQADAALKLEPQEEIVLYGKAVKVDLHTLTMEVLKIER